MKTAIVVLSFLVTAPALAQEIHTHGNHISQGGFGGPMVRFTEMNGQFAVLGGGHGGWVIDRHFILGGGGYALIGTNIDVPFGGTPGVRSHLSFGYGGLEMQYVDRPANPVHFLVFGLAGGGSAAYHTGASHQNDGVFVIEPGIVFTVHFTRAIHFNVGGTYRFVLGVDLPGLTDTNLSGFAGALGVDFGHF
jgi:hypothetical protein